MLERSRSSTGSNGTVCPAAICASLRARLAAIDSGTGSSGDVQFMREMYHKAPRRARENRLSLNSLQSPLSGQDRFVRRRAFARPAARERAAMAELVDALA